MLNSIEAILSLHKIVATSELKDIFDFYSETTWFGPEYSIYSRTYSYSHFVVILVMNLNCLKQQKQIQNSYF